MASKAACIIAVSLLAAAGAQAQTRPPCSPRAATEADLAARHGERPVGQGLSTNGYVLRLMVNPETGSWTALGLTPNGQACLLDAGESWGDAPAPPAGGGA